MRPQKMGIPSWRQVKITLSFSFPKRIFVGRDLVRKFQALHSTYYSIPQSASSETLPQSDTELKPTFCKTINIQLY